VTELDVAFAGVVTAGVVGVLAPLISWRIALGNQQHQRDLVRDERIYASRSKVYEDLLVYLHRNMLVVRRTHPVTGPQPPPPKPLDDDELLRLQARVAAFGSQAVLDLLTELGDELTS